MSEDFFKQVIDEGELCCDKARDFLLTVSNDSRCSEITIRKDMHGRESICFSLQLLEVPSSPVEDVRYSETIAVCFDYWDMNIPEVYALREDFPVTIHQNAKPQKEPTSLCLFDQPYEDLKLQWSASILLNRIIEWLSQLAKGELHKPDQILEPPFLTVTELSDYSSMFSIPGESIYFFASRDEINFNTMKLAVLDNIEIQHGRVERKPETLGELVEILNNRGANDLIAEVIKKKENIDNKIKKDIESLHSPLYLPEREANIQLDKIKQLEQKRDKGDLLFLLNIKISDSEKRENDLPRVIAFTIRGSAFKTDRPEKLIENISKANIHFLHTIMPYSKKTSRLYSGSITQDEKHPHIVQIGMGAIGSQIFNNLLRMGIGKSWSLVDHDIFLPHNIARHALFRECRGGKKAELMKSFSKRIFNEGVDGEVDVQDFDCKISSDSIGSMREDLKERFCKADLIIDTSTSIAVERCLALDIDSKGRRVSLFLNPKGNAIICLSEDIDRFFTLDIIEAQYYRELLHNDDLATHLESNERVNYGSCRDSSFVLSQNKVSLLSSIGSNFLEHIMFEEKGQPYCFIAQYNDQEFTTTKFNIELSQVDSETINKWEIIYPQNLFVYGQNELPESGIVLGYRDMLRQKLYVVDIMNNIEGQFPDKVSMTTGHQVYCIGTWTQKEECFPSFSIQDVSIKMFIDSRTNTVISIQLNEERGAVA